MSRACQWKFADFVYPWGDSEGRGRAVTSVVAFGEHSDASSIAQQRQPFSVGPDPALGATWRSLTLARDRVRLGHLTVVCTFSGFGQLGKGGGRVLGTLVRVRLLVLRDLICSPLVELHCDGRSMCLQYWSWLRNAHG